MSTPLEAAVVLALSGGELIIIALVALVLFGADRLPGFFIGLGHGIRNFRQANRDVQMQLGEAAGEVGADAGGAFGKPVADALTHSNQTAEFVDPPALQPAQLVRNMRDMLILWIAQGFGIGRVPFAPGTFGSLVGLLWTAMLLVPRSLPIFLIGAAAGVFASVWFCGEAERILNQKDPPSVVLDEIVAMPFCFIYPILLRNSIPHAGMPGPDFIIQRDMQLWTLGAFVSFRLFDIWKPWPVRQSQSLPGGWGVTVDDVLAAGYVNLALFGIGSIARHFLL